MILINSGKMNIPENEWFIGFSGDNLHSQKQFMITDFSDQNCTYNLYLTFDRKNSNGRYITNCIKLDSKIENGSTLLLWNIKEEHILKSGLVKAQIKVEDSDGEVFYTSKGVFFVFESADKAEDNSFEEFIDFTQFEEKLNEIVEEFKTQSVDFVPTSRKIAGEKLTNDISATQLQKAMSVYPIKVLVGEEPTTSTAGLEKQLLISQIDNEYKLYICVNSYGGGNSAHYQWELLSNYIDCVTKSRKIANISLDNDISVSQLGSKLNTRVGGSPNHIENSTTDFIGKIWVQTEHGLTSAIHVLCGSYSLSDGTCSNDWKKLLTASNIASSVSSISTNQSVVGAKLLYDTVGNIEETLDSIIAIQENLIGGATQ